MAVDYTGTGDGWQRHDLVFTVPSEQVGVGNLPPLPIPNFADSVVAVVPATIQSDDPDDPVGWGGASTTRTASSTATATFR
jgi:hypothetical protein